MRPARNSSIRHCRLWRRLWANAGSGPS